MSKITDFKPGDRFVCVKDQLPYIKTDLITKYPNGERRCEHGVGLYSGQVKLFKPDVLLLPVK